MGKVVMTLQHVCFMSENVFSEIDNGVNVSVVVILYFSNEACVHKLW